MTPTLDQMLAALIRNQTTIGEQDKKQNERLDKLEEQVRLLMELTARKCP